MREILEGFARDYDIRYVAATERTVHSPRCHSFTSLAYEGENGGEGRFYSEEPYHEIDVIDRIGSGDAYVAGFLAGLLSDGGSLERAVSLGNAAGSLKNTVEGDRLLTDRQEIWEMAELHNGKRPDFEMKR